jgi:hypothetical protein
VEVAPHYYKQKDFEDAQKKLPKNRGRGKMDATS